MGIGMSTQEYDAVDAADDRSSDGYSGVLNAEGIVDVARNRLKSIEAIWHQRRQPGIMNTYRSDLPLVLHPSLRMTDLQYIDLISS